MLDMTTTTAPSFLKRLFGSVQEIPSGASSLTLRFAGPADTAAIEVLAQLDSRRAPRGPVLVAEVGGELWAALSLDDHHAVADPFRPTGELVALLVERARQIHRAARGARTEPLPSVTWPKAGYDHAAWN
jgi:hypothetical protein